MWPHLHQYNADFSCRDFSSILLEVHHWSPSAEGDRLTVHK